MKNKFIYIIIMLLIISCLATFGRIADNQFINLDDKAYLTENPHVQSGVNAASIKWALTSVVASNWHPLTLMSHLMDWSVFGANAGFHHLVSLFFHIGSVIFLFLFLNRSTHHIWLSAFAAAFFALHPLRVESVAWASERKDVLSMFFGLATLYVYALYAEKSKLTRYLLCLTLFVLSLLSKPMLVTLPFVLLLLDYWPLGRIRTLLNQTSENRINVLMILIREKIPFIGLTVVSSIITLWAQNKDGSVYATNLLPFPARTINATIAYADYLGKMLWPRDLAVFYPYWFSLPLWKVTLSGMIIVLITFLVIYYIRKLPFMFVGWFWYMGTLVPVIGLIQVGSQAMADRYTYLPSIGITLMLTWVIASLIKNEVLRKKFLLPLALSCLIILSILTWKQCGHWKNSCALWNHALQTTTNNYMAHRNMASALTEENKINEAMYHYSRAIRLKPDYADAFYSRGSMYITLGEHPKALQDLNRAISLAPAFSNAYNNRAFLYLQLGNYQQALNDYSQAIVIRPGYADAYNNRAFIYLSTGDIAAGCRDAQKACQLGTCSTLQLAREKSLCPKN